MKIYKNYIINKLNNYDWSDEQILIIKDYILKSVYPIFKPMHKRIDLQKNIKIL